MSAATATGLAEVIGAIYRRNSKIMLAFRLSDTATMQACSPGSIASAPLYAPASPIWHIRLLHWAASARSHRVILLIGAIWLLNAFDLALTVFAHRLGLLDEENPLARYFLGHGTLPLTLFKIGLVLIGSYPLLRFRRARVTELGTFVILIAYAFLAVHWSECYELYAITVSSNVHMAELASPPGL